ncbi:unnamed protein product [Microthlaspi erraticum]|uniref:RNase H type-1 domain-containing protein n=1 Tax=Microthlaspi erraticum TaxID=1685480 RepID=A0A6D2IPD0_9BRAS|nr:unnamed protein product [Microthlaspi erraticum]
MERLLADMLQQKSVARDDLQGVLPENFRRIGNPKSRLNPGAREWQEAQEKTPIRSVANRSSSNPRSVRCHTDGAWSKEQKIRGMGWSLHDGNHIPITQRSTARKHIASPLIAEGLAIRYALEHALDLSFSSLHVASDWQKIIRAINSGSQLSDIYGILQDIAHLSSLFVDLIVVSIPREVNLLADSLAKQSLHALEQLGS